MFTLLHRPSKGCKHLLYLTFCAGSEYRGLPWWLSGKNPPTNAGDKGSILGLEGSLGGGNGNPLQHPCLGNPTDREAWWTTVHGVTESQIQLSMQ